MQGQWSTLRRRSLVNVVLFDWDGTLIDSECLGLSAFRRTFRDLGIDFAEDCYEQIYSPNWYAMYEALHLPREQWPRADELWLRHYGEETPRLVDGARESVTGLAEKGYRLGIVTSGTELRVRREIEAVGLSPSFEVVVCSERTTHKKPHPEGLEIAMASLGSSRDECCYVGDSPEDIHMGNRAGVLTVGVRSSFPGSRHIEEASPDLCLGAIREVLLHF